MTTGERIKARRKEIGVSAELLASRINVSPATVYRYERGDIEKIPGNILEPIAGALSTTPAYLMGWTDAPETHEVRAILSDANRTPLPESKVFSLDVDPLELLSSDEAGLIRDYRAADPVYQQVAKEILATHRRKE